MKHGEELQGRHCLLLQQDDDREIASGMNHFDITHSQYYWISSTWAEKGSRALRSMVTQYHIVNRIVSILIYGSSISMRQRK